MVEERLVRGPGPVLEPALASRRGVVLLLCRSVALAVGWGRLKREETLVLLGELVCGGHHHGYLKWEWHGGGRFRQCFWENIGNCLGL